MVPLLLWFHVPRSLKTENHKKICFSVFFIISSSSSAKMASRIIQLFFHGQHPESPLSWVHVPLVGGHRDPCCHHLHECAVDTADCLTCLANLRVDFFLLFTLSLVLCSLDLHVFLCSILFMFFSSFYIM